MRSRHISMSREDFDMLPLELGWKTEYSNGKAHFTPSDHVAYAYVPVAPRPLSSPLPIRSVNIEDIDTLTACFADSFHDTIEYCDCDFAKTRQSGKRLLRGFFNHKRGRPSAASKLALIPNAGESRASIAGAALILEHREDSAMLDLLFVHPKYRKQGIATALTQAALNQLHRLGRSPLFTRYHLGNAPSRAWHARFGFAEEHDLILARLYFAAAQQEYLRAQRERHLTKTEEQRLLERCEGCRDRVAELETAAVTEGMEGAFAAWRHQI